METAKGKAQGLQLKLVSGLAGLAGLAGLEYRVRKGTFDMNSVRDWNDLAKDTQSRKLTVHVGRVFGIFIEKNSDLPKHLRTLKGSYAFQVNNVRDQNAENAVFDSLRSTPATMEGSRAADAYSLVNDNIHKSADAEQSCFRHS